MQRAIAPFADIWSLVRLWWLLRRLKPDLTEFSTPKAGLLGTVAARLAGVPIRIYMLRGLKLETCTGLKRRVLLAAERIASSSAQVVLCNSESLRARAQGLGVAPRTKLSLLGEGSSNGVDMERFSPGPSDVRDQLGIPAACRGSWICGAIDTRQGCSRADGGIRRHLECGPPGAPLAGGLVRWVGRCAASQSPDHIDGTRTFIAQALWTTQRPTTALWIFWFYLPGARAFPMWRWKLPRQAYPS